MTRLLLFVVLAVSTAASPIIIRHDVDDSRYRIPESEFPALVDLPHEGHGVLIAPRWVVTAAHNVEWHAVDEVMIGGECRKVDRLIVHPGYRSIPRELYSSDLDAAIRAQASRDDIALLRLAEPIDGVVPVERYRADDEVGEVVMLIGKGATGNGVDGQEPPGSRAHGGCPRQSGEQHRNVLRRAFNVIESADERWLGYVFDSGPSAHPLEGMTGSGDSGGPALIRGDGSWRLAGLASWTYWEGDISDYRAGVYGLTNHVVRISTYAAWIDEMMAAHEPIGDEIVETPQQR